VRPCPPRAVSCWYLPFVVDAHQQPWTAAIFGFCHRHLRQSHDLICCLSHLILLTGRSIQRRQHPFRLNSGMGLSMRGGKQCSLWTGLRHGRVKGNAPRECLSHKNIGDPRRPLVAATTKTACRVELARARSLKTKDLVVFGWVRRHHHPLRCGQYRPLAADARERTGLAAERNTAAFFVARLSGSSLLSPRQPQ
jgi:hypothetical protein